jgi:hypothetical protein
MQGIVWARPPRGVLSARPAVRPVTGCGSSGASGISAWQQVGQDTDQTYDGYEAQQQQLQAQKHAQEHAQYAKQQQQQHAAGCGAAAAPQQDYPHDKQGAHFAQPPCSHHPHGAPSDDDGDDDEPQGSLTPPDRFWGVRHASGFFDDMTDASPFSAGRSADGGAGPSEGTSVRAKSASALPGAVATPFALAMQRRCQPQGAAAAAAQNAPHEFETLPMRLPPLRTHSAPPERPKKVWRAQLEVEAHLGAEQARLADTELEPIDQQWARQELLSACTREGRLNSQAPRRAPPPQLHHAPSMPPPPRYDPFAPDEPSPLGDYDSYHSLPPALPHANLCAWEAAGAIGGGRHSQHQQQQLAYVQMQQRLVGTSLQPTELQLLMLGATRVGRLQQHLVLHSNALAREVWRPTVPQIPALAPHEREARLAQLVQLERRRLAPAGGRGGWPLQRQLAAWEEGEEREDEREQQSNKTQAWLDQQEHEPARSQAEPPHAPPAAPRVQHHHHHYHHHHHDSAAQLHQQLCSPAAHGWHVEREIEPILEEGEVQGAVPPGLPAAAPMAVLRAQHVRSVSNHRAGASAPQTPAPVASSPPRGAAAFGLGATSALAAVAAAFPATLAAAAAALPATLAAAAAAAMPSAAKGQQQQGQEQAPNGGMLQRWLSSASPLSPVLPTTPAPHPQQQLQQQQGPAVVPRLSSGSSASGRSRVASLQMLFDSRSAAPAVGGTSSSACSGSPVVNAARSHDEASTTIGDTSASAGADLDMCMQCGVNTKEVVFLHADSVHRCGAVG